jgi:ActR/RegA family two-component response regulator
MASASPILCVVGNDEEASEFKKALASLRISNPVNCAIGANEAIAELEHCSRNGSAAPILVFLSLAAPEANRLAAWFEAHPQNRAAGLIAMTGFTDMRPVIQAYHLGVTAFLEWPLKVDDIRNALISNSALKVEQTDNGVTVSVN